MNVSPANSGSVKVNGSDATLYPAVFSISEDSTVTLEALRADGYMFSNWSGAVTGNDNPASLFVDCDKSVTATFAPLTAKLYFPHVASHQVVGPSEMWETEVCVINTGDQPLIGILSSYRNDGQPTSSDKTITVAAHGRWSRVVGDGEFPNPSEIGYMVFESASNSVVGYMKFYIAGKYRTAIPAVKEVDASNIYVSHIASNDDWWTGISLVNTTSSEKTLTITFSDGQSRNRTLAAKQHDAFSIRDLFDNQPQPDIQSAVISNASGIIGLELFGSLGWGTQLEGILLTDKTTSTIYYPHVASDDYWWTGIVAYNPSGSAATITITPYSAEGALLPSSTLAIAGKGKYIGAVAALGLPDQMAWFSIESPQPLSGFELFGTTDGSQLGAYAGGGGTGAKTGVFAKIEKSGWTGIAFVNTEAVAASVTLTAYNDNGTAVATSQVLPVDGHAKVVNNPANIFTQDISNASYIAFTSDRDVVGFQLNGSADGTMLDGLPGM